MDSLEPVTKFVSRIKKVIPSGKQLKLIGVLVVVAAISFAGYTFIPGLINKNKGSEVLSSKDEKPSFAVSKPDTISADEQVKFDPSKKVASYNDTLNGVNIVVSQQPLPETFKDNPFGELEKVASSFSATESFVVKDFKVYIGVSIKGPQSLILIKDKKLIFIQSESKIPNTKWVEYIETLKT